MASDHVMLGLPVLTFQNPIQSSSALSWFLASHFLNSSGPSKKIGSDSDPFLLGTVDGRWEMGDKLQHDQIRSRATTNPYLPAFARTTRGTRTCRSDRSRPDMPLDPQYRAPARSSLPAHHRSISVARLRRAFDRWQRRHSFIKRMAEGGCRMADFWSDPIRYSFGNSSTYRA